MRRLQYSTNKVEGKKRAMVPVNGVCVAGPNGSKTRRRSGEIALDTGLDGKV